MLLDNGGACKHYARMAHRNEYHAARDEAAEELAPKVGHGCHHCLEAAGSFPAVIHDPRPVLALQDIVRCSRILRAPETIPYELLCAVRRVEDLLADIEPEGTT